MRPHFSITHWDADLQAAEGLRVLLDQHYPDASIAMVPDSPRLKNVDGGAWLERVFRSFPEGFDHYFKIEPDVQVLRSATAFPEDGWYGHVLYHQPTKRLISYGGLWGFSWGTIDRVLQSGLLKDTKYLSRDFTYDRYGKYLLKGETPAPPLYSCDHIMADVMSRLSITPQQWNAVHLTFRESHRKPIADIRAIAFFS